VASGSPNRENSNQDFRGCGGGGRGRGYTKVENENENEDKNEDEGLTVSSEGISELSAPLLRRVFGMEVQEVVDQLGNIPQRPFTL